MSEFMRLAHEFIDAKRRLRKAHADLKKLTGTGWDNPEGWQAAQRLWVANELFIQAQAEYEAAGGNPASILEPTLTEHIK